LPAAAERTIELGARLQFRAVRLREQQFLLNSCSSAPRISR
jgi:hypothetical protein